MKLAAIALMGSLGLAGCATGGQAPQNLASVISQVQAIGVQLCAFEPTAATVAAILATGSPTVMVAEKVAAAICAAVQTKSSVTVASLESDWGMAPVVQVQAAATPRVNGVVVHGRYTK